MFYDTTYELGGLFVSVLSYQHIIFEGNKVIPIAFMLHEKRDAKFHERFFRVLGENVPNLLKTSSPFICDRESGIKKAMNIVFPNIPVVHCWTHIRTDVKIWVKKHCGNQDDISVYTNQVKVLLQSKTELECISKIEEFELKWSEAFRLYFHKNIKQAIFENSGRWILEKLNIFDPYSGVTNNPAESVNHMIKSVQKHKELPVDFICLHLYFLQKSIYTDIQCSPAGFGNYQLKKEFNFVKLDPEDIQLPKLGGTPNDILEQVRIKMKEINEFQNIATTHSDATEITSNNETHVLSDSESKLNDDTINTNNGIQVDEILLDKNATTIDDKPMSERKGKKKIIATIINKICYRQRSNKICCVPEFIFS